MPEIYCTKCGEAARSTDLFCRSCGAPLNSAAEGGAAGAQPEPSADQPAGEVNPPARPRRSWRSCCLFSATALVFFTLALGAVALFYLASQPGGLSAVKIEVVGSATPYPTRTPYRTASPYRTQIAYPSATAYPTPAPYPTTGPIRGPSPTGHFYVPLPYSLSAGCRINVKNQNTELDAVVIISSVDKGTTVKSLYVRARDSYSASGISTGKYYTFVTIGQNWDSVNSRFSQSAGYFRFEDPVVFTTCSSSLTFGSYQHLDITLNYKEGTGSDTLSVPPDSFPQLGQ